MGQPGTKQFPPVATFSRDQASGCCNNCCAGQSAQSDPFLVGKSLLYTQPALACCIPNPIGAPAQIHFLHQSMFIGFHGFYADGKPCASLFVAMTPGDKVQFPIDVSIEAASWSLPHVMRITLSFGLDFGTVRVIVSFSAG